MRLYTATKDHQGNWGWLTPQFTMTEASSALVVEAATTSGRVEFFTAATGSWLVVVRPNANWTGQADINEVSLAWNFEE